MPFTDLSEFVAHLEKHGQLHRITARVSRDLEIAEITDRVSKGPGAQNVALLFEHVEGSDLPVLIMSGFDESHRDVASLLREPRTEHILKPIDVGQLMVRLERMLEAAPG